MSNVELAHQISLLTERISVLEDKLNLKVDKGDIINQINISDEGVRLEASKIKFSGTDIVRIPKGAISKGTISGNEIKTTNLD